MEILDRLKMIVEQTKLSDRAFSLRCGIKQPTLDKQLKGLRAVSIDTVIAVCKAFPEISLDWFLLGYGDMFRGVNKDADVINSLIGTINTLQESINAKNEIIGSLLEENKQLKASEK